MQGRQDIEMLEVGTGSVNEADFIEIDLNDPAVQVIEIKNATQAFKLCMRECVINAAVQEYPAPVSFPRAVVNGLFCDKGEFSFRQTAKTVGSAGLAGGASLFSVPSASDAVVTLTKLFTNGSSYYFVGQQAVQTVAIVGNVTRTIILLNFISRKMFDKFLSTTPDHVRHLMVEKPTAPGALRVPKSALGKVWDGTKFTSRKIFEVASSVGANIPVLATLIDSSPAVAVTSFLCYIPLSLFGMDNLKLLPESKYPARSVEVNYMREQLYTFLLLPRDTQMAIINKIKTIEESQQGLDKDRELFNALLNLAKPEEEDDADLTHIMQDHPVEGYKKAVAMGVGSLSAFSQLPFTESAGVNVARLFAEPSSPGAVAAGVLTFMIALLPTAGLGLTGGKGVGEKLFVKHPTLGIIVNPELRDTLKWMVLGINLIAGGTSVTFAANAASDVANLLKLSEEASRILELSVISAAYTGSSIAFGQYLIDAMDDLVLFIAKNHADVETRRLMTFINGYTQLIKTMESINTENYCDVMANWKLTGDTELARTLRAIFSAQLSDAQYAKLQQDLSAAYDLAHGLHNSGKEVLEDRLTRDTYIVTPSFFDRHQGLRRRNPQSDDLEAQFDQSARICK